VEGGKRGEGRNLEAKPLSEGFSFRRRVSLSEKRMGGQRGFPTSFHGPEGPCVATKS